MSRRRPREEGLVLVAVLACMLFLSVIAVALLAYVRVELKSGVVYQRQIDTTQTESDAIRFAAHAVRQDNAVGRAGTSSTWTYDSVSITCTGEPGSGVVSGPGRTDRTVVCAGPTVEARYRFFDRGGSAHGVVQEQLSWVTSN